MFDLVEIYDIIVKLQKLTKPELKILVTKKS